MAAFAKPSHHSAPGRRFCHSLTTSTPSYDRDSTMRTLSRPFSFSFFHRRKRCSSCNSDLSAEDLDLKSVAKYCGQKEVQRSWEESAEDGCIFCRLITAVWRDARQSYGRPEETAITIARATDGQYLLRFPFASIYGLPHTLELFSASTITVYLKGKASPVDRHVLVCQHHRFEFAHPVREI